MAETTCPSPTPIRLTCRYSNGIVVSYVARMISYDDKSLRVLSSESFDRGIRLNVLTPIFNGIMLCRVNAVSRSSQTGYFELDLRLLPKAEPAPQPAIVSMATSGGVLGAQLATVLSDFASRLEQHPGRTCSLVLRENPPENRFLILPMLAAAVALLLQEKEMLDLRHLAGNLEKSGKHG